MNEIFNPVEIEQAIRNCANRIANSVTVCGRAYDRWLTAQRTYDRAFAQAYLAATDPKTGKDAPAHMRKYLAELATQEERAAMDVADAAYRFAERTSKAITEELRAWQSVGASVRTMYGVAGRGE